jgi:hypothetical protein
MPGWFQHETSLKDSPKARDLADILNIKPVYARGHLGDFWSYVFDHHKFGVIEGRNLETKIAEGASWDGDPRVFVDALVECLFIHRTEDAPDVCDECFPPKSDGSEYSPVAGAFVVHGWKERVEYYLRFVERKRIKNSQDAARQRKQRAQKAGKPLSVREEPRNPYGPPNPPKRGLRAAPMIVADRLRHAIESVTSRPISVTAVSPVDNPVDTSRKCHADELRDVTHVSRSASREGEMDTPPEAPKKVGEMPPSDRSQAPPIFTNTTEFHTDSIERDVTQTSRLQKRDVTHVSPCTDIQTNLLPKDNDRDIKTTDAPLVFSSQDEENPKGGAVAPRETFLIPEIPNDPDHKKTVAYWFVCFRAATGESFEGRWGEVSPGGRIGAIVARRKKRVGGYLGMCRCIRNFFLSEWAEVRNQFYSPGLFETCISNLMVAPMDQYQGEGRGNDKRNPNAGEDFRVFNPAIHDDGGWGPDN